MIHDSPNGMLIEKVFGMMTANPCEEFRLGYINLVYVLAID